MTGEEPVGRPLAEAADRDDPLLHLVVGQESKAAQVEFRACEAHDVLGLASREPERKELVFGGERNSLPALAGVLDTK